MVRLFLGRVVVGSCWLLLASTPVHAQWMPFGGYDACGCGAQTASVQSMAFQSAMVQPQMTVGAPISQVCYQQVAMTEYQPEKQMVRRPIVETAYEDRTVTEYRPVTEQRTVNVPTVDYQTVTEYQTVQKNSGYWMTKYQPTAKMAPCQYDPRPGFTGWLNRTGYQMRTAFTPTQTASREFVPQTCVQTVPISRRVAVQGSRQVTYNVTSMVPEQVTRKVAVQKVRYQDEEVTVMRPTTVVRTVPTGTQMAFGGFPAGIAPTSTVFLPSGPIPDATFNATRPTETRRSANNDTLRDADPGATTVQPRTPASRSSSSRSGFKATEPDDFSSEPSAKARSTPRRSDLKQTAFSPPSIVRVSRWVARTPDQTPTSSEPDDISVAGRDN